MLSSEVLSTAAGRLSRIQRFGLWRDRFKATMTSISPAGGFSVQYGVICGATGGRMHPKKEIVYIVDDDPIVRDGTVLLVASQRQGCPAIQGGRRYQRARARRHCRSAPWGGW